MRKNTPEAFQGPAQPLLSGINLAKLLCDGCRFCKLRAERRKLKELDTQPEVGGPTPSRPASEDENGWYDGLLPGRL